MPVRNLDRIFKPQRVAVIGASDREASVGYSVLHNLISTGFGGVVYPVNNKREAVQGIQAYPSVSELPHCPDLAIIATPAATVPGLVTECGRAGVGGVTILSAGFGEVGREGRTLQSSLKEAAAEFPKLRIIGPNCLGIIAPHRRLNASFAATPAQPGNVAFISQSGALCTSILEWAEREKIGFSAFVSIGNMIDVNVADLIDYFSEDPHTTSVILYLESITEARSFLSAARAFTRSKPIVAYKSGRFAESAKAAASHTGALAGEDAVYDAAFQRAGVVRASDLDELFDTAELLARNAPPGGGRLAIVTNAGGPGVIATDSLVANRGELAKLSDETIAALSEHLPEEWSGGNPIDILGDASADRFETTLRLTLADRGVDAVLVIVTPQAMTDASAIARSVVAANRTARKPILAAWMGSRLVAEGIRILQEGGVPTYPAPEHAIRAFMHLVDYGRNRELLYETPREVPIEFNVMRREVPPTIDGAAAGAGGDGRRLLSESQSKEVLAGYGIPVTQVRFAATAEDAARQAEEIGYPVVLKVESPEITHKTDVGGVQLNLMHAEDVAAAFAQIVENAGRSAPEAEIRGVTVQRMVSRKHSTELILGCKRDVTFGTVMLIGTGGIAAECFRDRALGLPPLNERLASRMLESLRSWPLLRGFRGRPGVNLDRLLEVMIRFSYMVADHPEITEFDINPLLASPEGVLALDGRAVVEPLPSDWSHHSFGHLAIRPWPGQFTRQVTLENGREVLLRPIRPEDEEMWHAMVAACSPRSIRFRFRNLIHHTTHEFATRYCFIDYDREMAIVAEADEGGEKRLVGVGRMVGDANHDVAEYAALVIDDWQGVGLGTAMTAFCIEIARIWGLRELVAETDWENRPMLKTLHSTGFATTERADGIVYLKHTVTGEAARPPE
ncbi:GNAT family N-acetyltransferase [Maioricimonas sp. JC845]|uniref:bifunctional acetate--CoA ligase family protein/GNAT family N-acetyltransferase n=1 Tax=Maioricimonas sp. JC845 TaxID=3232138 RepID=UPI00345AC6DE